MPAKTNLIFLGAPGAGKGTLAQMLSEETGIVHISTGDIFREEIKNETELGKKAKSYVNSGGLVPDELVADMVGARLSRDDCAEGFILDGFPRTLNQAQLLEQVMEKIGMKIDLVVHFEVKEDILMKRLTARLICKDCKANFNTIFSPPAEEGVCDNCGGELYRRPDDQPETAWSRLELYDKETAPLVSYYRDKGMLETIDAGQAKDVSYPELKKTVGA